ncbi:DMT family transporter [Paenibacillus sp. HWE-109]|uniref:DMT family transporter n=1 Tax=Paenibacillus sp. HWE-109 TaxID=1306526 RepID=UPI001EE0290D|nr:DMT family transporter [Paenibacillus sp. HWE-109]UKS29549.1 DMT family transporter [Paenibacillus sp. HWE-109]
MAYFSLILAVLIWGLSYIFMKDGTAQYPKDLFQLWRYVLVSAIYVIIFYKSIRRIKAKLWVAGLFKLGLANFVLSFFSIYAIQYTTPTRIVMINSLIVGVVPLLQYIHYKTQISLNEKMAIGISLIAITFLLEPYKLTLQIGDVLGLIGMIGYAYTIVIMNQLLQKEQTSVIQVSFLTVAGSAFYFGLVAVYYGLFHSEWFSAQIIPRDVHTIAAIAFMIVIVSIFSNLLQSIGQRKLSSVVVAIVFCLEPVITAVFDYILLGNVPSTGIIICGFLLVLATITASMKKVRAETSVGA